jgi:hypothetical protein
MALGNGIQSAGFMSTYVFLFQIILCVQRNLMDAGVIKDEWRFSFWLMGFLSAASIFIEKKQRRSELALYVRFQFTMNTYISYLITDFPSNG